MSNEMNRRRFLKLASTAAFAMSAAGLLASCDDAPASSMNPGSSGSSSGSTPASSGSSSSSQTEWKSDQTGIKWNIVDNGGFMLLKGYDASGEVPSGTVVIPSQWEGRPVEEIYVKDTLGQNITRLVVPGTVKRVVKVGSMPSLKELILQQGVETVGQDCFAHMENLQSVQLPSSIRTLEYAAFYSCPKLSSINLPEGLKTVGERFLAETAITTITLPSTMRWARRGMKGCKKLKKVVVNCDTLGDGMFEDCTALTDVKLSSGMQYIFDAAFKGCSALQKIDLPESLFSGIGTSMFEGTALRTITIPKHADSIGNWAFQNCKQLTEIRFASGSTLDRIAKDAFDGADNLRDIYFSGTKERWQKAAQNVTLSNVTVHFV